MSTLHIAVQRDSHERVSETTVTTNRDISQLTEMIETLASDLPALTSYRQHPSTPRSSRFLPDPNYSTPHKEPDDPNWPTRDISFSSQVGNNLNERPPRYPSLNTSPRRISRSVSTKIDDHIYQRGFLGGVCSDITVVAFNKTFLLHKIILDASPFFSMMFAGPWKDSDAPSVVLQFDDPNITRKAFEFALSRLYGKIEIPDVAECLALIATAAYLDMPDLQEQCTDLQLRNLNNDNISQVVSFALGQGSYGLSTERLKEASRALLLRDGYEMDAIEWAGIPIELVADIVSSDAFFCPSESERYAFIVTLMKSRGDRAAEVEILEEVLTESVHYMHMTQKELKKIKADGIVSEHIIHKALWDQIDLKEEILLCHSPVLGITQSEETEYEVPHDDTCYIGDPLMSTPGTMAQPRDPAFSLFPPFRFSAEFDHINDMKDDTRVYSHTVFYAGSYWNIYIHNKFRARKSRQLGVYLHRVEIKIPGSNSGADMLENSSPDQSSPSGLSSSPPTKDAQGTLLSSVGAQGMSLSGVSDGKRPYVDHRSTISTYFKIYCPTRKGTSKIGVTEFRSGPDEFHRSQSWGWKSRGLCAYDEREVLEGDGNGEIGGLKFMVVLGVV